MAGIYIHIPFCKQACHYCDFHFSTSLRYKQDMISAMQTELKLQQDYLGNASVDTIYFGGGTPSLLTGNEVNSFVDNIAGTFNLSSQAEITLEANPDDLDAARLGELKNTPVNRFSIGIQSFFEEDLRWMNRAHNASDAAHCVMRAQEAGFENITIDLIYGYPLLSDQKWQANIRKAIEMRVPHISAYSMTVEPQTALASFIRKGSQTAIDESQSAAQFSILMENLNAVGFEHYEISNFALPGRYSRHNSNYWKGVPYLGIGPSAHSFNTQSRQWNVANNPKYLKSLALGLLPFEIEQSSKSNKINEYIMTSIRTMWGLDLQKMETDFGSEYRIDIERSAKRYIDDGKLICNNGVLTLSKDGKFFADQIAAQLFVE